MSDPTDPLAELRRSSAYADAIRKRGCALVEDPAIFRAMSRVLHLMDEWDAGACEVDSFAYAEALRRALTGETPEHRPPTGHNRRRR